VNKNEGHWYLIYRPLERVKVDTRIEKIGPVTTLTTAFKMLGPKAARSLSAFFTNYKHIIIIFTLLLLLLNTTLLFIS
jgi:hypothetical protein